MRRGCRMSTRFIQQLDWAQIPNRWADTHDLTGLLTQTPTACWNNELQGWPSPVNPLQMVKLKSASGIHTHKHSVWMLPATGFSLSSQELAQDHCLPQLLAHEVCSAHQLLLLRPFTLLPSQASSELTSLHQHLLSRGNTPTELNCHLMRKWDILYCSN